MDTATRGALFVTADQFVASARNGPWPAFRSGSELDPAAEIFLRGIYEDASVDELDDLNTEDLAALAHEFWRWRSERAPHEQAVRIRMALGAEGRALDRDILEVAGPDMPFLVDSVMGEVGEQGLSALAMFHPTAPSISGAGQDSLIQIHLPKLSAQRAKALLDGVRDTLADVRASVSDFRAMRERMSARAEELASAVTNAQAEEVAEAVALMHWLAADKFTFLGVRDYAYARTADGKLCANEPDIVEGSGLGVLRNPDRYVLRTTAEPIVLAAEFQRIVADPTPLIVAKSTLRSMVHRRTMSDYVGIKRYNEKGEAIGETRFVGLFTSEAFTEPTRNIPVLRRKSEWVLKRSGFPPGGHNYKTLRKIIEYYPREELWQLEREELLHFARGVLHLLDRPRARVFTRRDRFNRFVTALAYIPKDRYNTDVRERAGEAIARAFGGVVESFQPQLGEGQLARVLFVIGDIDKDRPDPDAQTLDNELVEISRDWQDRFTAALMHCDGFSAAAREQVLARFDGAFSAGYQEAFSVDEALEDIFEILHAREDEAVRVRAYRRADDPPSHVRLKFYSPDDTLALSQTVPMLENMGLFVESEQNFELDLAAVGHENTRQIFVHDVETRTLSGEAVDLDQAAEPFEQAFAAIWSGLAENDGFNRLILQLGIEWREAALLRALARYRQQSGLDPMQGVQEDALAAYPKIARLILALFKVRFDPDLPESMETRRMRAARLQVLIEQELNAVESLDHDRALRRIAALLPAIQRTNYFQTDAVGRLKPYMSFKIASRELEDLPAPKPYREIWVASPQVEGVHLRFGPVARGGLRWSDRRDDFRTEVLDLVKAQQVKNAIIVPVGAKGGFFPKRLPPRGAPNFQEAGIDAYKTFLRGLLDITDNIVDQSILAPKRVIRWDDDDPYLVVAADKGTATFSDIANGISAEYGHWLGDAFASGGSAGYDHKAMGITAKGAWEAVKRHFREIGKNIQEEEFTVIGVGDMSGDVFGNGMLLSRKIRLLAAFDHRDIFIDPNPQDCEAAWNERKRLYDKPRSSWADYDKALISKGGGVFSRSAKSIPISPEIAALTGLAGQTATPFELMSALLMSPCELLWFGGIGAYIKASAESNADVGDKTNDAIRVDAAQVRAHVIGEGANLGVTQKGRIEFARHGGRINTDAVDNSAGVDTSDHEVNIKILLADVINSDALKAEARDALLESMTDDVAALVLADNYDQTGALTIAQSTAPSDLDSHERFIQRLEHAGKLARRVEGLPLTSEFASLRAAKLGLTRPELSKLIAYAKIDLFDMLTASSVPDDPAFIEPLKQYFPDELWRFETQIKRHRLRREIIATQLADDLVNRCGPSFIDRVNEITRADAPVIASAFEAGRRIFEFEDLIGRINALDNKAPAEAQTALHQRVGGALRRATTYLVRNAGFDRDKPPSILDVVALYRGSVAEQRARAWEELSAIERERVAIREKALLEMGAPQDLARDGAMLAPLTTTLEVADLARNTSWPVPAAAALHCVLGAEFGLDALRDAATNMKLEQHWDRLVVRRAAVDFGDIQLNLAQAAAKALGAPKDASAAAIEQSAKAWIAGLGQPAMRARAAFAELNAQGGWTFAKLMLVQAELGALASAVR
ncbi:MAG: NAD-glutamate dehydrogenase [Hyphomonadaceae bacterium]|nr:NAD-glutamate dehydrogenase [Hyphomonadaceae bacterium]